MPSFPVFNIQIDDIYNKFNKFNKKIIGYRKYKMYYHMHPNRRLKKMLLVFANPILKNGPEAYVPFFTISVNRMESFRPKSHLLAKKDNKEKYVCIYNNFYVGGVKEIKLNFTTKEDEKSIQKNIKELQKVIKMVKLAYKNLHKDLRSDVDFYKQ